MSEIRCPECAGTVGDHLRGCSCATWERLVFEHLADREIRARARLVFEHLSRLPVTPDGTSTRVIESFEGLDQLDVELAEIGAKLAAEKSG